MIYLPRFVRELQSQQFYEHLFPSGPKQHSRPLALETFDPYKWLWSGHGTFQDPLKNTNNNYNSSSVQCGQPDWDADLWLDCLKIRFGVTMLSKRNFLKFWKVLAHLLRRVIPQTGWQRRVELQLAFVHKQ